MRDIQGFFPGVTHDLAIDAMKHMCPCISPDFRDTIIWLISPSSILRRPDHPHRMTETSPAGEPGPKHLLQGDVLAPLISNLVGTFTIDRPLAEFPDPDVVVVRYSDDFVIFGSSPTKVVEAMDCIEAALKAASLRLHPDPEKTMRESRDIRVTPLLFLGKIVHGSKVYTPDDTLAGWASCLVTIDPISGFYDRRMREILNDFTPDDLKRLGYFERLIRTLGGIEARSRFRGIRDLWLRARRHGEPLHEPDLEDDLDLIGDHVIPDDDQKPILKLARSLKTAESGAQSRQVKQDGAHQMLKERKS